LSRIYERIKLNHQFLYKKDSAAIISTIFPLSNSIFMIEKREFGFVLFKEEMLRHKKFKDKNELEAFLRSFVPSDVFYSCAYYENPEAEMKRRDGLGLT